jgi:hypothetical protein
MAAVKGGEAPLSAEKNTGPQPVLTDEQWAIVFEKGCVQNAKPVKIYFLNNAAGTGFPARYSM